MEVPVVRRTLPAFAKEFEKVSLSPSCVCAPSSGRGGGWAPSQFLGGDCAQVYRLLHPVRAASCGWLGPFGWSGGV